MGKARDPSNNGTFMPGSPPRAEGHHERDELLVEQYCTTLEIATSKKGLEDGAL